MHYIKSSLQCVIIYAIAYVLLANGSRNVCDRQFVLIQWIDSNSQRARQERNEAQRAKTGKEKNEEHRKE